MRWPHRSINVSKSNFIDGDHAKIAKKGTQYINLLPNKLTYREPVMDISYPLLIRQKDCQSINSSTFFNLYNSSDRHWRTFCIC